MSMRAGRLVRGLEHAMIGALLTFSAGVASAQSVSQLPLSIPNVPGNLVLVPSVEWPTLDSLANLGGYSTTRAYVGYFDPDKCYLYSYNATESLRHFYPARTTTTRQCSYANREWSGNYLNWATTQTIDPFRKALTGGYRVRDTATETWLEKARYDRNGANDIFPNRRLPAGQGSNATLVGGATPANWNNITSRIWQLDNRMRFTRSGVINFDKDADRNNDTTQVIAYNPTVHTNLDEGTLYEVSVRVKVCDSAIGVEDNCRHYPQGGGWKPEGLIQRYSERLRYSVFGYLNDGDSERDGGVLRARQKFVGEKKRDPVQGLIANANREWNPTTGQLIENPDPVDATATTAMLGGSTIANSGVINYINRFGQMTSANHKNYDPVSELYYAAIRYLKHQGNISQYTDLTGTAAERYTLADGFPVITNWDDPMQYRCQKNALLGIGDTNTWYDKNLPGNDVTASEPGAPDEVANDDTVDVAVATAKVAELEGIDINTPFNADRVSSAYIAGLAYDAHTVDMRTEPNMPEVQTASTYWVDVREAQKLAGLASNQYWLATKYGGFTVPKGFKPYAADAAAPDLSSWWSGEYLATDYPRPSNFYVASEADTMVQSLSRAFARIAGDATGSGSALASSSARLEDDPVTFQATFKGGAWSGDLQSFVVNDDGTLQTNPGWSASARLAAATWSSRNINTFVPGASGGGQYRAFTFDDLSTAQKTALGNSEDLVNYLRGDRSREEGREGGIFRTRTEILGDIVNSSPVFVGKPNARLYTGATFTGASAYPAFVATQATRTPAVYVGANDGMLHGFNANNGDELYAYVPNAAITEDLRSYSNPGYEHRYFVDGEIAVADVYVGNSWKTILVGTMGRGGPGVFALDVTNPSSVQFLWEKGGADIPALGKNLGRPVIAQVADGDWRVILGNGPGSTGESAQMVMISVSSGAATVVNTAATGTNGLAAVLARSNDGDAFAETAYAGDMRGNFWKFSNLSGTPSVSKMFEARGPSNLEQPITAAPTAARDPETGIVWVYFGTGRYLDEDDTKNLQVQTWYGIKDEVRTTRTVRSDLVDRNITEENRVGGFQVRLIDAGTAAELDGRAGWFIDLVPPKGAAQGERIVLPPRFIGSVLTATSRIPNSSDACRPSGRSWIYAINSFTGTRLDDTFFDLNNDSEFNEQDMLDRDVISGIMLDPGLSGNSNVVGNTLQNGDDLGGKGTIDIQGGAAGAGRMSWRELVN